MAVGRAGVRSGQTVIDVGCGPLGALLPLAEIVGPTGHVVGLDQSAESLARARQIVDRLQVENVELIQANVNEVSPDEVRPYGLYDAAFCRAFLSHQSNPAHTLGQMAALVRPGGHIIAHEWLYGPHLPQSDPEVPELDTVNRWLREMLLRAGASPDVPRLYHEFCRELGLREVGMRGFFVAETGDATRAVQMTRDTLIAIRTRVAQLGIATDEEVAGVLSRLDQASGWNFKALFTTLLVELVAQVPG
jgi:SAM-dependent methyltransferase